MPTVKQSSDADSVFRELTRIVGGIVALLLICCTLLLALHVDIAPIIGLVNLVVTPLLGLLGVKMYQKLSGKMENVESQVNGRMTTLIEHSINSVPIDKVERVVKDG